MPRQLEYRVKAVTRYIVTEWYHEEHEDGRETGGGQSYGEFDWERAAYIVANSLGSQVRHANPEWEVKFPQVPAAEKI